MCAAENSHDEVVRAFGSAKKTAVDAEDRQRRPALSWAAASNRDSTVACLLDAGASTEICDMYRRTPLLWAAVKGYAVTSP
jgi:ankyrin repeat protein